ncbi:MAG: hypothetical protein ACF8GE_01360, partial [Phycisphaerales bacterium JB043]
MILSTLAFSSAAEAQIPENRVLLLYNSNNAESQAVRDAYVAAHPGVLEFDLNNGVAPGNIPRTTYLNHVRAPLLAYLQGPGDGMPLYEQVVAIATTRGLPARISGANEFTGGSTYASLESELVLLHQDLEALNPLGAPLDTRAHGPIDNPYHELRESVLAFPRSGITTPLFFALGPENSFTPHFWQAQLATPGHMYLVCRLDAAPSASKTALENTVAL